MYLFEVNMQRLLFKELHVLSLRAKANRLCGIKGPHQCLNEFIVQIDVHIGGKTI